MMAAIESGQRLIIFRPGQLGDTLVAFPSIEGLSQLFPDIPIVYCTNRFRTGNLVLGENVARLSPFVKQVVTYYVENGAMGRWLDLKRQIRVRRDDILIYLPYPAATRWQLLRDWLFFRALGFRKIIGFRFFWRWANSLPHMQPPLLRESHRLLAALNAAGLQVKAPAHCAVRKDEAWAHRQWRLWGLNGKKVLALCPGGKMQAKRWPVERFIAVGREWHRRTGAAIVVVGGPEEASTAAIIVQALGSYGFSACGASLSQTAAILARSRVYCGNDTGSMHLAAIMGVPCVALFSSREPQRLWFPHGDHHLVLSHEVPCSPCGLETCHQDPSACIAKITVTEVLAALEQIWEQTH